MEEDICDQASVQPVYISSDAHSVHTWRLHTAHSMHTSPPSCTLPMISGKERRKSPRIICATHGVRNSSRGVLSVSRSLFGIIPYTAE